MILEILKAIILGAIEGVTEFLPISSTGHLILLNQWITFSEAFTKMFDVVIQLGAILAMLVFFWPKVWPFGKEEGEQQAVFSLWKKTIVGVIPAIIVGGLLGSFVEKKLFNPWVVAVMLILGGIVLIVIEKKNLAPRFSALSELSFGTAFAIGLIQCLSLIPGTSRSAATIIGAMLLGASRAVAVEFSFFLAIPTMIAASAYSLLKHRVALTGLEIIVLAVGFITAFIVALIVIRYFIRYIQNHDFKLFGYYRIVLGILIVLYFIFR